MRIKTIALVIICVAVLSGCSSSKTNPDLEQENKSTGIPLLNIKNKAEKNVNKAVDKENNKINKAMEESGLKNDTLNYAQKYSNAVINTNYGKIKVKFYNESSPATVDNFLKLADEKFYNRTKFHRVMKDFMIQGGDPNSKDDDWSNDGMGGPGYKFKDEINNHKLIQGSLAMANSGPNTNGSQFFIVTAKSTPWLDGKHTNFGEVIEGLSVVEKIESVKTNAQDHPMEDIVIKGVELLP